MYALLPWKTLGTALMIVVGLAVYADNFGAWVGVTVSDSVVIRYLPVAVLTLLGIVFGLTAYWAPWRFLWRTMPVLNRTVFPDLNGVWVGTTASNWPTIEKMRNAATTESVIDLAELYETAERHDAIAVEITASLYSLRLATGLSSMDATSYSITARPWKCQHTPRIHLAYVYEQETKDPSATDEERHMGAADLVYDAHSPNSLEGVYWTRRSWIEGLNTAGRLRLRRVAPSKVSSKTLRDYALEEKARLDP
ncbi:hypothetical protein [uncultured Roseobacter sp.]|uniref:hypothetical protein n=1 Tax=uncultured Roseobacter sp. TaxID=114847 RepID=UPI002601970D|nr:hypothetical protein [uncultured Roseobacter sp.]